jgi:hypothetical protein
MRVGLAIAGLVLAATAGCNGKVSDPAPPAAPPPASTTAPAAAPATIVVFTGRDGATRTVGAVVEDGSRAPVQLSAPGADTTFAAVLPGRRVLLVEAAADGSLAALAAARADTGERASLGALPAGQYAATTKIVPADDGAVAELARAGSDASDVLALRAGAEPRLLAALSHLVGVSGGRAAVMTVGNLRSVALDGSAGVALGAGDGHDQVAAMRGDRILLTIHEGTRESAVRLVDAAGSAPVDTGGPSAARAVALTETARMVYARAGALVSAALDGKDEQVLTRPDLGARFLHVTADGQILAGSAAGALLAVGAAGGAVRVLDPAAGSTVRIGAVQAGQVVYTCDGPHWPALRAAALDGSGVASLIEAPPALPLFAGLTDGGRVVFYRSLAGQLEGGQVMSVKLSGDDLRQVGATVSTPDGQPLGGSPLDQDFEALTPSGRLVLESEFAVTGGGSQLLLGAADSADARLLAGATHVRFAALVP